MRSSEAFEKTLASARKAPLKCGLNMEFFLKRISTTTSCFTFGIRCIADWDTDDLIVDSLFNYYFTSNIPPPASSTAVANKYNGPACGRILYLNKER